jgi:predicted ArsR family transcriptional regulator
MTLDNGSTGELSAQRVLSLMKRRGPQRISDISAALAITDEAARQQLARLSALGLVHAVAERHGVGRPAREWALTDAGHARFPDRHAELTLQLLDAVRTEFGDVALDRMIAQREETMRRTYAEGLQTATSVATRVARLAKIRSREGYMAEVTRDGAGWLLIENHCPICAAATACQNFCRSELEVFRDVLGAGVEIERTEHLLAGARRCAYRITPTKDVPDGVDRRDAGSGSRDTAQTRRAR